MRASQRLTDSAACLVAAGAGPDRELERLLARQDRGVGAKPILEINTRHALVKALADAKLAAHEADVTDLADAAAGAGADPRRRGARRSGGLRRSGSNRLVVKGIGVG